MSPITYSNNNKSYEIIGLEEIEKRDCFTFVQINLDSCYFAVFAIFNSKRQLQKKLINFSGSQKLLFKAKNKLTNYFST